MRDLVVLGRANVHLQFTIVTYCILHQFAVFHANSWVSRISGGSPRRDNEESLSLVPINSERTRRFDA